MMTTRSETFNPLEMATLNCVSKCVRGQYLMGKDRRSGKDFDYRREWVESKVAALAKSFAIDVITISIMATHYHLQLRNRPNQVASWSDKEVIRRVCRIFPSKFERLGVRGGEPTPAQLRQFVSDKPFVQEMRVRLSDTSWFMRQLNQHIAARANLEDGVTGHFFESRFRSRVVTDDLGVLLCSLYIDLNPIRARVAETPEESKWTSAYRRIKGAKARKRGTATAARWDGFLCPISTRGDGQGRKFGYCKAGSESGARASDIGVMEMTLEAYLELLDWSGRQLRRDKRGKISADAPPILARIGLDGSGLVGMLEDFENLFHVAVGSAASMVAFGFSIGRKWLQGTGAVADCQSK
jgi:hypothetical protein